MAYIFTVKYSVLFGLFNFGLGLGLLNLASALTSALRLWPRPRPRPQLMASASASSDGLGLGLKWWPRPRPQVMASASASSDGLGLGLKWWPRPQVMASASASSIWPRLTSTTTTNTVINTTTTYSQNSCRLDQPSVVYTRLSSKSWSQKMADIWKGNRTFLYFASLPPTWTFHYNLRQFATWTVHYLDISSPGCFAPLDILTPGWFTTSWTFHHLTANYKTFSQVAKRPWS